MFLEKSSHLSLGCSDQIMVLYLMKSTSFIIPSSPKCIILQGTSQRYLRNLPYSSCLSTPKHRVAVRILSYFFNFFLYEQVLSLFISSTSGYQCSPMCVQITLDPTFTICDGTKTGSCTLPVIKSNSSRIVPFLLYDLFYVKIDARIKCCLGTNHFGAIHISQDSFSLSPEQRC